MQRERTARLMATTTSRGDLSLRGSFPGRIIVSILSFIASTAVSTALVKHTIQPETQSLGLRFALILLLTILFIIPIYLLVTRYILSRLHHLQLFSLRSVLLWVLVSLAAGAYLVVVIPDQLLPEATYHHLEIVATGQKNSLSKGSELWVIGIYDANGSRLPTADFKLIGQWEVKDDIPVSAAEQPATLSWDGPLFGDGQLKLSKHPLSGIARVTWDGQSELVDLYAEKDTNTSGDANVYVRPLPALLTGTQSTRQVILSSLFYVADGISIGLFLFLASSWLVTRVDRMDANTCLKVGRWSWLWYALPCALVWFSYLLAFWPGLMSPDSITQWQEMVTGTIRDLHPAFHTLTNWLVTRLWFSPAAVAVTQIAVLSIVFGLTMRELEHWRVPLWVRVAITALFSLSVANGMLVITLWKDIAYSIAVLGLFTIFLHMVRTNGQWLKTRQGLALLWLALVAASLYRHNGLAMLAIIPCLLFIDRKRLLTRTIVLGIVVLGTVFVIVQPVYNIIGVRPVSPWFAFQTQVHQVSAMVKAGVPLNQDEQDLLTAIQPLENWRDKYNCYSVSPVLYNNQFRYAYFDSHANEFLSVWRQMAIEHPDVLLKHFSCISSMVWSVGQPSFPYVTTAPPGIFDNNLGLRTDSKWPGMQSFLSGYLELTSRRENLWWGWRPALYLYVTLFCIIVAALRLRTAKLLLIALPALINSLALLVLITTVDMRFQYSVYMIGLIAPALLFAKLPAHQSIAESNSIERAEGLEGAGSQLTTW